MDTSLAWTSIQEEKVMKLKRDWVLLWSKNLPTIFREVSFFDIFFTSKALICDLEEVKIYGIATSRTNRRHFPEDLKKNQVQYKVIL